MHEDAQEIFDHLPIRRNIPEDEYIDHLWGAVSVLAQSDTTARSFALMPFHLLFMLALQYKILRIAKEFNSECNLVFVTTSGRNKSQLINPQKSVFDLALLNEKTIPELFSLINLDGVTIELIKDLVDYRNDSLAHAKGGIEDDPEGKIRLYLSILKRIQDFMLKLNDEVATKWLIEMRSGQEGVDYIELHLAEEYLCPSDMQQGKLSQLEKRLNSEL